MVASSFQFLNTKFLTRKEQNFVNQINDQRKLKKTVVLFPETKEDPSRSMILRTFIFFAGALSWIWDMWIMRKFLFFFRWEKNRLFRLLEEHIPFFLEKSFPSHKVRFGKRKGWFSSKILLIQEGEWAIFFSRFLERKVSYSLNIRTKCSFKKRKGWFSPLSWEKEN